MNENDKQAEPVAWMSDWQDGSNVNFTTKSFVAATWVENDYPIQPLYTHPAQPVQPAATPEEFNAQSFASLWSSYCDKKMEIEDLKVVNEQLLGALKDSDSWLTRNHEIIPHGLVHIRIKAAIAAAAEKAKGGV